MARFANDAKGHRQLIRWATRHGKATRVCLEATGVYSLEFALALQRHNAIEVMVANPRAIKDFARAFMQRAKTDGVASSDALPALLGLSGKPIDQPQEGREVILTKP
ncbi:MAG: IS110 family transposase [Gammaproteobacteria bacterium]